MAAGSSLSDDPLDAAYAKTGAAAPSPRAPSWRCRILRAAPRGRPPSDGPPCRAASGTERKDGARHPKMHRTPSVAYAACLLGERLLVLEDSDVVIRKGDVVIQLGNWHSWDNSSPDPAIMAYVMIGGEYG